MVTFARRTHSGRYVSYSRDDLDSDLGIGGDMSPDREEQQQQQYASYHVHIPVTPDNQPMDLAITARVEEQYVSNSLFTGGFNSVTRAHLMDKVIDSEASHP
ncbi:cellulose synthase-like protein D2 [Miscanthus floridulus]|uniref:cellulose synthase-like protein D2 n=1 Tax=Miscanthus floridulus TaxID=154761 RepID=UPI0034575722